MLKNKLNTVKYFLPILLALTLTQSFGQNAYKISRSQYQDRLYGFWLGECIGNWTGLTTEMNKVGKIGDTPSGKFYTHKDWGKHNEPNIWNDYGPNGENCNIDFVFKDTNEVWGADDDTDIEYIYQHLLYSQQKIFLTGEDIRDGWLKHIKAKEENYLWVSNQVAFDLMKEGMVPPATSDSVNNMFYNMIDAQLTTEIFGLFAPTRRETAIKMAHLPIRTSASGDAAQIAEFYVIMHALASATEKERPIKDQLFWMASEARKHLNENSYQADMYDFVKHEYEKGKTWEHTRNAVYKRYQVQQKAGYDITSKHMHCNGCFAAGINFASSMVSLFYGEGDLKETIKIGTLCGWDSDNPTATWGGLIGFMIGKEGVEKTFNRTFSNQFNIHRTRQGFDNNGIDTFDNMASKGLSIVDRVVTQELGGRIKEGFYIIPKE